MQLGPPHFIIRWLTNCLNGRSMRLKLGNVASAWISVNAAVPREHSGFGVLPLLYKKNPETSSDMAKYVDDTTLCAACKTTEISHLQDSAAQVESWVAQNSRSLDSQENRRHGEFVLHTGHLGALGGTRVEL